MRSIKPGRGPSMMSGVMGIFVVLFAVFWTIAAASMGGGFMVPFGLIFIGIGITQVIYNFKNATSKNRYSAFDITDGNEEPDPLNQRYGQSYEQNDYSEPYPGFNDGYDAFGRPDTDDQQESLFCPYCGTPVEGDFEYCHKCGKKLP